MAKKSAGVKVGKGSGEKCVLGIPDRTCELVTFLSYGAGQDSETIRKKIEREIDVRKRYVPGHLVVVMADTKDEHKHTMETIIKVGRQCAAAGVEFHFLTTALNKPSWRGGLIESLKKTDSVIMRSGKKSCSYNLKADPIYKFINQWLARRYYGGEGMHLKQAMKRFAQEHGRIRVLVGIAKGEETRMITAKERKAMIANEQWWACIEIEYPLIHMGLNRAGCQNYLTSNGDEVPWPSNCVRCPFMSKPELVWAWRNERAKIEEWMEMERRKLEKNRGKPKNHCVLHETKTIREVLDEALAEFGDWSDERLNEYKFSHGHCVASKY